MKAEIIAIGSELLLGQIIDTNTNFIARVLAENGIELVRTSMVGDDLERMKEVIKEATEKHNIVITTGGLGPTEDDLTREAISEVFGCPLTFQPHLMDQIEAIFKRRGFKMSENNRKQAYIPRGAIPIENPKGTAPGFILEYPKGAIISIPGVPLEMEYLMRNTVIPYLRKRFDIKGEVIKYKVLRTCGLGESAIDLQIKDLMRESKNPTVGTLASIGDIKIRITAKGRSPEESQALIKKMEDEIRNRLGILIYGVDDETLQGNTTNLLEKLNLKLSLIETITGGIISQKLTNTNTNSFSNALILSSQESQRQFLNMSKEEYDFSIKDPKRFTAFLAQEVRKRYNTDFGLATFAKHLDSKENGEYRIETYYSISTIKETENHEYLLGGELWMIRERASIIALDLLRKFLIKNYPIN